MKPQIVNIINFIRGVEPRDASLDLYEAVERQWMLLERLGLPGTFLVQYDALIMPRYVSLLKRPAGPRHEIGAWFEVVQPLAEKAGIPWRGRPGFAWDWHANTGFSVGYSPEEREKLVDVYMSDFRDIFGCFPRSVGSWMLDAHTLAYLADRYGILAACICKDQWGTDGYTLWGGYYGQAYYPGKRNAFCPAGGKENQINVPVFRMLGSDPIYQYDAGLELAGGFDAASRQPVVTLEPVYPVGGGSKEWVDWFFRENFNGLCLSFGYVQIGQENSFGWPAMEKGLEYQLALVSEGCRSGKLRAETLAETGKWFRERYDMTPASSIAALTDWKEQGRKSVWYCSRRYRINILQEEGKVRIRDIHLFRDEYPERYLTQRCESESFQYDNLPVMDGNRWCVRGERTGIMPVLVLEDGSYAELACAEPEVAEAGESGLQVRWHTNEDTVDLLCEEDSMTFTFGRANRAGRVGLLVSYGAGKALANLQQLRDRFEYQYDGFRYAWAFQEAVAIERTDMPDRLLLLPDQDKVRFCFQHCLCCTQ